MKLKLSCCAILCALAANIPLVPSAFAQESVSITLGTNNVENGLFLKEPDGGATTVVTAGGSEARSTAPPAGKSGQFMYFATDPAFANNGSVSNLWVTVEYFDEGTNSFRLEYDAQPDPDNINPDTDSLTVASGFRIFTYDSKQWLSYTFVLHNVFFGKRQPGGSDFRIDDWTIDDTGAPVDGEGPQIVRKVIVSKTQPTAFHIQYASTPIKIDGNLDDPVWQSAQIFLLNRAAQDVIRPSAWKSTNDYSAVARFAWDTNYLYAAFDTTDDIIRVSLDDPSQAWNGDGAEIFFGFDQSNPGRTTYIPSTDFHIMMSAGPNPTVEIADLSGIIWTNTPGQPFPPSDLLAVKDHAAGQPSGYVLEARIPWELLFDPTEAVTNKITPGQLVGFSIFGNDGDDPAAPTQEKALSLTERAGPSNNPSSWDTVQMDGPSAPPPLGPISGLLGYWRMDETNGTVVADWSGRNHNGKILNSADGSWVTDPERGTVYRATGTNSIEFGTIIPAMSLTNDFTWSLWIKSDETGTAAAADNNIVFGNRYKDLAGADFNPREFVKFTPSNFEWHWNGAGQNVDYTDFVVGTWTHHVVVKQANKLAYYRDGVLANGNTNTITGGPTNPQPLYLGGQGTSERWKGYADEVAIFDRALSATEVQQVFDLGKAGQPLAPQPLLITTVTADAANLTVTWTGGTPPFKTQARQSLSAGNWADVGSPTNVRTATVPRNGATGFVRIVGQ